MSMKKRKLVLVEWIDSHGTSGNRWQDLDDIENLADPLHCRSVGWLIANKNGMTVIAPHLSGEKNGNITVFGRGEIAIPNIAITKLKVLRG